MLIGSSFLPIRRVALLFRSLPSRRLYSPQSRQFRHRCPSAKHRYHPPTHSNLTQGDLSAFEDPTNKNLQVTRSWLAGYTTRVRSCRQRCRFRWVSVLPPAGWEAAVGLICRYIKTVSSITSAIAQKGKLPNSRTALGKSDDPRLHSEHCRRGAPHENLPRVGAPIVAVAAARPSPPCVLCARLV